MPDPAAEAIKERLGSSGTYSMLQSASKLGICYFRKSFALIPFGPDNSETICRIQDIVQVGSEIYLFVDVFPHEVMHHDENGVLQTTAHVLDGVETSYLMLSLQTNELSAMWSFKDGGSITFITKW